MYTFIIDWWYIYIYMYIHIHIYIYIRDQAALKFE